MHAKGLLGSTIIALRAIAGRRGTRATFLGGLASNQPALVVFTFQPGCLRPGDPD
jgi:hypothetical protein